MKKYRYLIGIDPGTKTGLAVWDNGRNCWERISTEKAYSALFSVLYMRDENIFVRVEDARKRKWFGKTGREKLQGAGSIKRDCVIWEEMLTDYSIPFEMVAPKNIKTKIDSKLFEKITGYTGRTSNHARDAAMLVYGR